MPARVPLPPRLLRSARRPASVLAVLVALVALAGTWLPAAPTAGGGNRTWTLG